MKRKLLILSLLFSFFMFGNVNAKCDDENINALANEILTNFYVLPPSEDDYGGAFRSTLVIENIPEDMFVIVINNDTQEKQTFKEIKDGYVEVEAPDLHNIYDYTVKIYSSNAACENELLRTTGATSKIFNAHSTREECEVLKSDPDYMSDFEPCNEYTSKLYDDETFLKEYNTYIKQQPEEIQKTLITLFYKYYYFALIPMGILAVYYSVRLQIIRRRKKKDEEE